MAVQVGERVPEVRLKAATQDGIKDVTTSDLFAGKKVVLFAVPGAFTPTCSARHLPGFIDKAGEFRAKGIDRIVCVSVNDAFVMESWGMDRGAGGRVVLVADGNGSFAEAVLGKL